ncbi:hypothetical protein Ancab_008420, partial [Ancistrocladus abbreviatus]
MLILEFLAVGVILWASVIVGFGPSRGSCFVQDRDLRCWWCSSLWVGAFGLVGQQQQRTSLL